MDLNEKIYTLSRQLLNIAMYNEEVCDTIIDLDCRLLHNSIEIQHLYTLIKNLKATNGKISPVTLCNEPYADIDFITSLASEILYADADTVIDQLWKLRSLTRIKESTVLLNKTIEHGDYDLASNMVNDIYDTMMSTSNDKNIVNLSDLMRKKFKDVLGIQKRYKFPVESIRQKMKYIKAGHVTVIAAEPGGGKTTLAGIIAQAIPNTLFVSYEMTSEDLHNIFISRETGVDSERIDNNELDDRERHLVDIHRKKLAADLTMQIMDGNPPYSTLLNTIRRLARKKLINGVIIDYAQIIPGLKEIKQGNKVDQYEDLSRALKNIAKEYSIFIVALSQLTKDSLREKRAPILSDLRGSLSFGADADNVIFLYSYPDDSKLTSGTPACSIGKQRRGKVGRINNFKYIKNIHRMF